MGQEGDRGQMEAREMIAPGNRRQLQRRRAGRRRLFDRRLQELFLEHLAGSCNVAASAEAAGVAVGTVYAQRAKNPVFREAWEAALDLGYAALEAALLKRAIDGVRRPEVRAPAPLKGEDSPERVDWDKGVDLLRQHRRGMIGSRNAGAHLPRRVPPEAVAERLVAKLRALGVRLEEEAGETQAPGAGEGDAGAP